MTWSSGFYPLVYVCGQLIYTYWVFLTSLELSHLVMVDNLFIWYVLQFDMQFLKEYLHLSSPEVSEYSFIFFLPSILPFFFLWYLWGRFHHRHQFLLSNLALLSRFAVPLFTNRYFMITTQFYPRTQRIITVSLPSQTLSPICLNGSHYPGYFIQA